MTRVDVIDTVLGSEPASRVAGLRAAKPELAAQMQDYYEAIFQPSEFSAAELLPAERWLIAIRTASHTGSDNVVAWYEQQARDAGVDQRLIDAAKDVLAPYDDDARMHAIMRHVDLIVTRPVESSRSDIDALAAAGLSPAAIVSLSQVVAYVSYQLRLIAAFRALGDAR